MSDISHESPLARFIRSSRAEKGVVYDEMLQQATDHQLEVERQAERVGMSTEPVTIKVKCYHYGSDPELDLLSCAGQLFDHYKATTTPETRERVARFLQERAEQEIRQLRGQAYGAA